MSIVPSALILSNMVSITMKVPVLPTPALEKLDNYKDEKEP